MSNHVLLDVPNTPQASNTCHVFISDLSYLVSLDNF